MEKLDCWNRGKRDEKMMSFPRQICTNLSDLREITRERRRGVVCISAKTDSTLLVGFWGIRRIYQNFGMQAHDR